MTAVINVIAFPLLAIAWLAFGVAALRDPAHPTRLWNWFRHLSLVVQGLAWLLLLPVVLALWIWHASWPLVLRLSLVVGLAWVSLYVMLPGRQ
jgi:hypothetical protein